MTQRGFGTPADQMTFQVMVVAILAGYAMIPRQRRREAAKKEAAMGSYREQRCLNEQFTT